MPRVGFEPTISAGERPKTYALDRAATGTWTFNHCEYLLVGFSVLVFKCGMENLPISLSNIISYDPMFLFVDVPHCHSV